MGAAVPSRSLTPDLHVAICTLERNVYTQRWLREQVGGIEARLDEMARSFERLSKQLANG